MSIDEFLKYFNQPSHTMPPEIQKWIEEDCNGFIDTLFLTTKKQILNNKYSKLYFEKTLEYLSTMKSLKISYDRNYLIIKVTKLIYEIEKAIALDYGKNHINKSKLKILVDFKKSLELILLDLKKQKQNMQITPYQFIDYLIEESNNLNYLKATFKEMPSLLYAKDEDNISLFQNIARKCLTSIENSNDEKTYYYSNIISLIASEKRFNLTTSEKKAILKDISNYLKIIEYSNKNTPSKDKAYEQITKIKRIILPTNIDTNLDRLSLKYNIPITFDEELINNVKMYNTPLSKELYPDRIIFDDFIITIDDDQALEIDDGLSCKKLPNGNYLLGVHIASALGYFPYDSKIINEAISRYSTIYLPYAYQDEEGYYTKSIHQFPRLFSTDIGSLKENTYRLTRSYFYEIAPSGEITNFKIYKTIIKNNKRTTYNEVDHILKNGSENKELQELIFNLDYATSLLNKSYNSHQPYFNITSDYLDYPHNKASLIVSTAMNLTGFKVANYFAQNDFPLLYRVLKVEFTSYKNIEKKIRELPKSSDKIEYTGIKKVIASMYPKAYYSIDGPHQGLGLKHFCHCTAVLRRAADIVCEHAQEICYDKEPTDQEIYDLEEEIKNRAIELNSKSAPIEWFISDYAKTYQKKFDK